MHSKPNFSIRRVKVIIVILFKKKMRLMTSARFELGFRVVWDALRVHFVRNSQKYKMYH